MKKMGKNEEDDEGAEKKIRQDINDVICTILESPAISKLLTSHRRRPHLHTTLSSKQPSHLKQT